jgi:hypothetical protein
LLPFNTASSRFPNHKMMVRSSRSFKVIIGPCVTSSITSLIPTILLLSRLEIREPTTWDGGATKCLPTRRYTHILHDQSQHPTKVCYRNMSGKSVFTKLPKVKACKKRMPKRNGRFQISTHLSRENVWGLHAQLQISAEMVFAWVRPSRLVVGYSFLGGSNITLET